MRRFHLSLFALMLATAAWAQPVPTTINYQGRLTDNTPSQTAITATAQMQFAIYDAATGGSRLWQEPAADNTGASVTVTTGIFNYVLGNTVAIPATVFTGATSVRYLQITLDPSGSAEILSPRQLVTASGYANLAENANNATSANNANTVTNGVYTNGSYADPAWITSLGGGKISGAVTNSNQLGGVASANWQRALATPACLANQYLTTVNQDGTTVCAPAVVSETDPKVGTLTTGRVPYWNGTTLANGAIYDNGNVGIGTSSPTNKLDIAAAARSGLHGAGLPLYVTGTLGSGTAGIEFRHDSGTQGIGFGYNTIYATGSNATQDLGLASRGTGNLNFSTNATQRMIILGSNGNVGLGTVVPYAKLHVVGSGAAVFSATNAPFTAATSAAYIRGNDVFSTATTPDYTWYNSDQTGLFHPAGPVIGFSVTGFGEVMRINNNRLGIGTAAPGGLLELGLDQGRKPGTNTWTIVSDERLKTIEGTYNKGLKELLQLQPIVYHYKNVGERSFSEEVLNTQNVGFSAQEVQKVFPEAVGTDADGYLNLNSHSIMIAYLNAIKEQQAQIETLKSENATVKAELEELKKAQAQHQALKAEVDSIKEILQMQGRVDTAKSDK